MASESQPESHMKRVFRTMISAASSRAAELARVLEREMKLLQVRHTVWPSQLIF